MKRLRVARPGAKGARILIVEDDPSNASALAALLSEEGLQVHSESRGSAAMRRLEERGFDLLVLEPALRDESGPFVLRRARQLGTPTIIVTADPAFEELRLSDDVCVKGFFYKPVRVAELLKLLRSSIRSSPLRRPLPGRRSAVSG